MCEVDGIVDNHTARALSLPARLDATTFGRPYPLTERAANLMRSLPME